MRAGAEGQEVIHRDFVPKVQDTEACGRFHAVRAEEIVGSDRKVKAAEASLFTLRRIPLVA